LKEIALKYVSFVVVWVNLMEEVLWHDEMWKRYVSLPPIKRGLLLAIAGLIQHFSIAQ
jgi:uncharacterized membrane protein